VSKPKRYTAAGNGVVRTDPKGDLVLYKDYARLLIEMDELKSQPDPLTAYLYAAELAKDDIKRLKAEVERLTKAGDAMAEDLLKEFGRKEMLKCQPYQDWLAAKEGKPRA
jgi:hypothetical protein